MITIYAEKPDMGEKIAKALGGATFRAGDKKRGYYGIRFKDEDCAVTWGYGHLCALADASDYDSEYKNWSKIPIPFFPENYKIILNRDSKSPVKATYEIVKALFEKSEYIINATDFDREGELIFWYLYSYMKCRTPYKRAKLTSTTDAGICEAFDSLMDPKSFAGLLSSAQCRSIADWAVGINLTVAMTLSCGGGSMYSIGRVQTPTLDMIVTRDEEIENFRPEKYYTVEGTFTKDDGETYKGTHRKKRFDRMPEAKAVLDRCAGHNGIVKSISDTESEKAVPHLYDMDSLQMDAAGRYGISLKKVLDIVQSLYEKGYVTYPRTDCQYLPENMYEKITGIQEMLKANGYADRFSADADEANMYANRRTFFDDSKLGSHFAVIPTENMPSGLSLQEQQIYDLIAESVIQMLYPPAKIGKTTVITDVNGEEFVTRGTRVISKGWLAVGKEKVGEEFLPELSKGEEVDAACRMETKQTQPPKRYTDKTILAAMVSAGKNLDDDELKKFMASRENSGIGTVATRAGIIETLISRGYASRESRNIVSTVAGRALIHAIPVEDVKSAEMTAVYEKRLNDIVEGRESSKSFLNDIYSDVADWCGRIKEIPKAASPNMNQTDLACPVCGMPLNRYKWGYGCSGYKKDGTGCGFSMGAVCGKVLTENQMRKFFSKGEIGPLTFRKKDGTAFDATLALSPVEENGTIVSYRAEFKRRESVMDDKPDVYAVCPKCHGTMRKGRWGWECENGCGFSIPYTLCGRDFAKEEAEALITQKSLPAVSGFISKKQKPFSAGLKLKEDFGGIEFVFPERKKK